MAPLLPSFLKTDQQPGTRSGRAGETSALPFDINCQLPEPAPFAEIYFIVANGIGYSAMPGFANSHSPEDIWRLVLWVRHLSRLTPEEKAAIESETRASTAEHEHSMEH